MSSRRIKQTVTRKKTSSNFRDKVAVRCDAIDGLESVRVLDCFHAKGELWNRVRQIAQVDEVLGIEKNKHLKSIDKVIYGNNLKVMQEIDIDRYNVIDLDAFGSPLEQMEIVFRKAKLPKVVIYTFCFSGLSGIPGIMSTCRDIQSRCRTIVNGYFDDMFSDYLHKHGVKEYYEIELKQTGFHKHYGYFMYNPIDKHNIT